MEVDRSRQLGSSRLTRLFVLAAVTLMVAACSTTSSASGNLHLKITGSFDDTAQEESLWHKGTLTADGSFPAAKLDTMDIGAEYGWDLLGSTPWTASTQQQMGDFVGDCNGGQCDPCVGEFGGNWEISAVQLNMQERGNGRYVFTLWLGSDRPPKVGGCDAMINQPAYWANRLTVTLTGMDSAAPSASVAEEGFTATVTKG